LSKIEPSHLPVYAVKESLAAASANVFNQVLAGIGRRDQSAALHV
jgi:hypothetical protein